jgi:hypothetical protein
LFKKLIILFLLTATSVPHSAQTPYLDSLLTQIAILQKQMPDANYQAGMYPSQRLSISEEENAREDDNVFFTGLIVWTLKSVRHELPMRNQVFIDTMSAKAMRNYPRYKNKHGGPTYNFWQTNPSRHFPNDPYFSKRKKYMLPDDLDDTAILYLSGNFSDSLKHAVKHLMSQHANRSKETIQSTYRKYKHMAAYSTWFGKQMPIDFDICVQANALRFVLDNKLELDEHDIETIHLLKDMVAAGEHVKSAHYISPHYKNPNVVLYHLSRLVAAHPEHHGLVEMKPQLIQDLYAQMKTATHPMERLLLQTSLLRFGEPVRDKIVVSKHDMETFYFFVANMTSTFPNPLKGMFAKNVWTNFYYRCEAYYLTLLFENEVLRLGI